MAVTKLQATQTVLHDVLSELGNAADDQLNTVLDKVNTALKIPGQLSLGSGLVVNVGNTTITRANGTKVRLVLGDVDIGGLSGSINLADGTTVTGDVQVVTLPTMTANQWYKAGFEVRADKKIYVVFGAIGASEALAGFPNWNEVSVDLGYISLQVNSGGTAFTTPTAASINQFGAGGSGEQLSDHTLLSSSSRATANQHPTTAISTITGEFTGSMGLSATEDETQKALVRLASFGSIFNWTTGKNYRIGNIVKATGTLGTTLWRCITSHVAGATFDSTEESYFELVASAQNHNTLAERNAANQHPTTSIDTATGDFAGALSATEDTAQKALVRLEQFNSTFDWVTAKAYRVGNTIKTLGTIYRCIVAHTSDVFATDLSGGKWELVVSGQDHNTLANRDAANSHLAAAIATSTASFTDFLRSTEDDVQKALVRLNSYTAIRPYNSSLTYRINDLVMYARTIWRCTFDGSTGAFNEANWMLAIFAPLEEVQTVSASGGQSVFTLSTVTIPTASSKLMVFVNGIYQLNPTHYGVTIPSTVTFTSTLPQNAQVVFRLT